MQQEILSKGKRNKRAITDMVYAIDAAVYKDKIKIFRSIPEQKKISVLIEVSDYSEKTILKFLRDSEIVELVEKAESDDAVEILEHLEGRRRRRILNLISKEKKNKVVKLLKYAPDTAGGVMQSEIIVVNKKDTVKEALEKIRAPHIKIRFNNIYVLDRNGKLVGVVSLKNLIRANRYKKIYEIMRKNVISVHPKMDQEKVARIFRSHRLYSLPVVDGEERLLGRITYDDIIDIVEEEIQEDIYKTVGLRKDEDIFDPVRKVLKGRATWLILNLFTAFLAAATVSIFEGTLEKVIVLAVFMPVVAGMGGNAGTQTLTVVIRGIAIGRFKFKDYKKVVIKEVFLGFMNGVITGILGAAIAIMMGASAFIGLVIFLAMIVNLINAGISGTIIPVILRKLGQDPALGSGIILTTFTDVIGFLSYLGIATILINVFHLF